METKIEGQEDKTGKLMFFGIAAAILIFSLGIFLGAVIVRNRLKQELQKQEIMEQSSAGSVEVGVFVKDDVGYEYRKAVVRVVKENLTPLLAKKLAEAEAYQDKTILKDLGELFNEIGYTGTKSLDLPKTSDNL